MAGEAVMATRGGQEVVPDVAGSEQAGVPSANDWAEVAQSRSSVYGFLAALYSQLPDMQFANGVIGSDFLAFLESVKDSSDQPSDVREGAALMAQFAQDVQGLSAEDLRTKVRVERTRLLRGVKPGYGPLPPYESVYAHRETEVDAHSVANIAGIYARCGAAMPEGTHEQPDYIGLELDFMRHLCAKEAQAWQTGNVGEARIALDVQRQFLAEHLGMWVPSFCDAMRADAQLALYQGLALFTKGFVEDEVEKVVMLMELTETP